MAHSHALRAALAAVLLGLGACGEADAPDPAGPVGQTTVVSGETDAPVPGRAADPPEDAEGAGAPAPDVPQPVTITAMQAGDVACDVTVTDAAGATRQERASFEICERADLIGQTVTLRIEPGPVMAASCEGNPDCPDSETVPLIVEATPLTD